MRIQMHWYYTNICFHCVCLIFFYFFFVMSVLTYIVRSQNGYQILWYNISHHYFFEWSKPERERKRKKGREWEKFVNKVVTT